jgi:hypothetical protein
MTVMTGPIAVAKSVFFPNSVAGRMKLSGGPDPARGPPVGQLGAMLYQAGVTMMKINIE